MSNRWSQRLCLALFLLFEPEWRALNGRSSLGLVFWVYGVLVSAVLALRFLLAWQAGRVDQQQILLLVLPAYTAAILVAVLIYARAAGTEELYGSRAG